MSTFNSTSSSSTLSLNNNRLSGFIPTKIHDMINVDILEGNYFDCKYDRSDLPSNDKNKDTYDCGSNLVDVLYYIWLGLVVITLVLLLIVVYQRCIFTYLSSILGTLQYWLHISTYHNIIDDNEIDDTLKSKVFSMIYLQQYIAIHGNIRRFSLYCTIFIIIILLPIYTVLDYYYRTHTYDYSWTVAMIFLSGKIAFGVMISALIIFIITQMVLYNGVIKRESCNSIFKKVDTIRKHHHHDHYDHDHHSNVMTIWFMYVAFTAMNLTIVGCINFAYVLAVLYGKNKVLIIGVQILLSIFKLMWNNLVSPTMVRLIIHYLCIKTIEAQSTLFFLQFVLSISNNIIIPCLTIMIISPNCLYNAFHPGSDVRSIFHYTDCSIVNQDGSCIKHTTYASSTSYKPPFTYSYQCSSAFIEYYAPVFVFVCILSTFIIPLSQVLWIRWKFPNIFQFSNLLYLGSLNDNVLLKIDEIYKILILNFTFVGLILTFGTIFPPLALAFFLAMCCQSYYHQAIIGRYLKHVVDFHAYSKLDVLEDNLKVQPLLSTIHKCGWFLVFTSCSFYTLFLFDTLGDDVGSNGAYWVLIVMPCLPLCFLVANGLYRWLMKEEDHHHKNSNFSQDGIQLSAPIIGVVQNPLVVAAAAIDIGREEESIIDIDVTDRDGDSIIIA
jgi:hypothetical protein